MASVNLFHLRDGDAFGSVLTVDTGSVVVQVFDAETLRRLHVHRPVLLQGRPGRSLIGIITRITRKIQAVEDDGTEAVPEIVSIDSVEVGLIGTLHNMGGDRPPRFRRAIETIPEIDALCFSLEGDRLSTFMRAVSEVSEKDGHPLLLGRYALDNSADAFLNGDRLFQRHVAIVGSTGSGKSWTTARLLEQVAELPNANGIVFDIHGEYSTLKGDGFRHLRIAGPGDLGAPEDDVLFLPYWLLGYEALRSLLVDRSDQNAPNQGMLLGRFIREEKEQFLEEEERFDLLPAFTIDSPIPFWIENVLAKLDGMNKEMVPGAAAGKEKQGDFHGKLSRMIARLEAKVEDRRLGFLFECGDKIMELAYLDTLVTRLLAGRKDQADGKGGVKIIDFSEVPSDILPLIVSMVAGLAFSVQQWTPSARRHPVALFCDEAHNYIPDQANEDSEGRVAVRMFERIAKEGRKYGIGLAVISQRPAEVSRTVISQCNNVIAMRLTNPEDQARVKALLPDTLAGFTDMLPVLDTGEAVVVGDASLLPSRIRVAEPRSKPDSRTIDFWKRWSEDKPVGGLENAVEAWRRQSFVKAEAD
jgi:uncharacterized protein